MTHQKSPIDFPLFLIVWNRFQGQSTPLIHLRMADWLQARWDGGQTRLLLMAFRSCGKSTITGLFAAWLLLRRPDLRILVLAAESLLARRMVRNVRRIIERHPLTAHLKPKTPDQWAADRFTINRPLELRDPSMLARGISGNITGSRADIILCDDVEVPNTCDTAEKRAGLREKLSELDYILSPGGSLVYVGTPHSWFTIYAESPREEIGETQAFLGDYTRLKLPLVGADGRSVWPERYNDDDIARLKRQTGINKFTSQMMLEPVNIAEGRLNPAHLLRYADDVVYTRELNRLDLGGRRLVGCSAWWDPAFGGGDGSVLAIVFTDDDGDYWLHRVIYLERADGDVATAQSLEIARAVREFYVPSVTIEINGIGKFLPQILRKTLARERVACTVLDHTSTRAKNERILEAFQTVMAARVLHVHQSVFQTPFITEMQEWRPGIKRGRDDGLDAAAGALLSQPIRLKTEQFSGRQLWHGGAVHQAITDFRV